MNVISNSSPLIALSSIDRLTLLHQMFDSVVIPDAVYRETVTQNRYQHQRTRIQAVIDTFITVLTPTVHHLFSRTLGDGEQGVLNLGLERQPDIVLLDDKKARKEASALGLIPVFTSDILKRAAKIGLLASYQDAIHELAAQQIYPPEGHGTIL
jgi:predicted nucleic acid-binding protein